jgi:hypothetical protein
LTEIAKQAQEKDEAVELGANIKSKRGKKARPNYSLSKETVYDDSDSEDSLLPVISVPKQKIVLFHNCSGVSAIGSIPAAKPNLAAKPAAIAKPKTMSAPKKRVPIKEVLTDKPSPAKVNTTTTRAERSRCRSEIKGDTDLNKAIVASKAELERKK